VIKWDAKKNCYVTSISNKRALSKLENPEKPNLLRDIFPYVSVGKQVFNNEVAIMDIPEDIFITDTTFRDGQQARPPYTVKQIVDIYTMLHKLSGNSGIIRQSEFFLYSAKDKEAVTKCLELDYKYPEVTAWVRANFDDLKLVKEFGLKETGILTSVSDYHIYLKLGWDRKKALENYLAIIKEALSLGIKPRCHFEDVTRADFHGFVIPFVLKIQELSEESGIDIKIRLCDTLGYGVPFPQASIPRGIPQMIQLLKRETGISSEELEWHGHNDFHKALINGVSAWLYGCSAVNGSLLGFGERTGNPPIEALIFEYLSLREAEDIDTTIITELANYFEKELGYQIPPNYPFIGKAFNATSAGIHADGVIKNEQIYNIFDTKKLLNRPIKVTITDKSGLAGIAYWVNQRLGLTGENKIDKKHPSLIKIYNWIEKQYDEGRTTSISDDEMEKLCRKYLPELFVSEFDKIKLKAKEMVSHLIQNLVELPEIKSMDPQKQEEALKNFVQENPFVQFAYITDKEGIKITRNITQVEDKPKYEKIGYHEDFSDREWFIEPVKTGKIYVTDLYTSRITGALCVTVSAPIRNEKDEIVGVIGLDIKFDYLAKTED
jgi:isopropylmalate/homocitrate/citramalate synthase